MILFNTESYEAGITTLEDGDMTIGSSSRHAFPDLKFNLQTHSKDVVWVDEDFQSGVQEADGLLSASSPVMLGVTVADCMPIYICARCKNDVKVKGVLHSGSKGTGILANALEMIYNKYEVYDIEVSFGPHISPYDYVVDKTRAVNFAKLHNLDVEKKYGRYHINMLAANMQILHKYKLLPNWIVGESTYTSKKYSSYRRQGADKFTRMLAFIR